MKKYIPVNWKNDAPGQIGTIIDKEYLDHMQTQYLMSAGIQVLDSLPPVPNAGENVCVCNGILYVYINKWIPMSTVGDLQKLEQTIDGKVNIAHATAHTTGTDKIPLGNGTVAGLSTNDYKTADKNKVDNVPADTNSALANNHAASKKYVDDRVNEGSRIIWSYERENAGKTLDIGVESIINIPNPPPQDSIIFAMISRRGWRTAATGFWTTHVPMRMVLPFETMTDIGSVGFRGRLHIIPHGGTTYTIRTEVSEVSSSGNTNWRWETPGIFVMHYITAIPVSGH